MIKVGIDTTPLKTGHAVRGVGVYTQNLIETFSKFKFKNKKIKIEEYDPAVKDYNIIHYPYFDLFFHTLPLRKQTKIIVTIHDTIPLVFSQHYKPGIRGKIKFYIQKLSLKGVSGVITDSENSKKDIVRYLGYPSKKIYVVYLAPLDIYKPLKLDNSIIRIIEQKYNLPKKFILYVGDVNYNKNIPGLLKAIKQFNNLTIDLVLVGKAFKDESLPETEEILQLIKALNLEGKVLRLGWIPEKDLVKVYNLATLYCQPSFYEGFGIPVLEAMKCGCPVAASNVSSLPEICGDAVLLFDPYDYNDIADKLENVFHNSKLREDLVSKGLVQVKKFSWEKTARKTLGVYEQVAEEK